MTEHNAEIDALADWLGAMPEARNVSDYSDEATTVITIDVEMLAERLIKRGTAPAQRGRRVCEVCRYLDHSTDQHADYTASVLANYEGRVHGTDADHAPGSGTPPGATHPNHWRRHGHEGEPCPTDGSCYGGES